MKTQPPMFTNLFNNKDDRKYSLTILIFKDLSNTKQYNRRTRQHLDRSIHGCSSELSIPFCYRMSQHRRECEGKRGFAAMKLLPNAVVRLRHKRVNIPTLRCSTFTKFIYSQFIMFTTFHTHPLHSSITQTIHVILNCKYKKYHGSCSALLFVARSISNSLFGCGCLQRILVEQDAI